MASSELTYRGVALSQLLQTMATGFSKAFPAKDRFVINGTTYTGAQLSAVLLQMRGLFVGAEEAREALIKAIAEREAKQAEVRALVMGAVAMLEVMYGRDNVAFAKFGVPAKVVRRELTVEEKLASQTKAQATRKLRGSGGSREAQPTEAPATAPVTEAPESMSTGVANGVVQLSKAVA